MVYIVFYFAISSSVSVISIIINSRKTESKVSHIDLSYNAHFVYGIIIDFYEL